MKLIILTENFAGSGLLAEHGLSYIIEHENEKFLFDTGPTNVFIKNANKLGINVQKEIDTVILSHGHWDHGDGLEHISNKTLITHPNSFMKRFRKKDHSYLGLKLSKDEIEKQFNLVLKKEAFAITKNIIFLGQVPRKTDFESKTTPFLDDKEQPDFVMDDSAITVIQNNELIIITACSHAGICNIIEHAKKVTGINTVKAVIGGFHLKQNNLQTKETINYLIKNNIKEIYPSHCTALPALAAFHEVFNTEQLKTGMILNF
ncbi:MBL fold metallo-hydrolase [Lutibacter holmesii]|uniref:MBL fold metallo-hydrolase n=1 Tax=Lutibacter holmesii TaxID=1137985 RepID=A0ABW3WQ16_9FLAO